MEKPGMAESEIVFYVGSRKLVALAGTLSGTEPRILSHAIQKHPAGFEKGFVVSLDKAAASIESVLESLLPGRDHAEISASVVLGNGKLKTYHFASSQYFETARTLSALEVRSVINQTKTVATLPLTECVLQAMPESFTVNDLAGIRDPLGLEAARLGVDLKIFTMNHQEFKNIANAFEAAEISVKGFYPKTLTVSEAVLTEREKEEGVLVIDIADDAVQLVVWKAGRLLGTHSLPLGSRVLTEKVAQEWGIENHDAEKVKEQYGSLQPDIKYGDELIPLVERKGKGAFTVQRSAFHEKFSELAKAWITEILGQAEVFAQNQKTLYPHYVFTGGGTALEGFLECLQKQFSRDARLGASHKVEAPHELLVDTSLAPALGMYRWLAANGSAQSRMTAPTGTLQKTLATAKSWFSNYF